MSEGRARARWQLLARALLSQQCEDADSAIDDSISIRRFGTFGLMETRDCEHGHDTLDGCHWRDVSLPSTGINAALCVRFFPSHVGAVNLHSLVGFNNTGNVCVWPSEELLAVYCLRNTPNLVMHNAHSCNADSVVRVIELGGGMTALAGLFLAANSPRVRMCLTDGNSKSVRNIARIVQQNQSILNGRASAHEFEWGNAGQMREFGASKFDLALAADCCFFDDGRQPLLDSLIDLLRPGGRVVVMAPTRNGTLELFATMLRDCAQFAEVQIRRDYDRIVTECDARFHQEIPHIYDRNLHFPLLLTCTKI